MNIVEESGILFNFERALRVFNHDKTDGDGNNIWNGVDFRIELEEEEIWLEVKNWNNSAIPEHHKAEAAAKASNQFLSKEFARELRAKFYGTSAYLSWTGQFQPKNTIFVILLEVKHLDLDSPLRLTLHERTISALFPGGSNRWTHRLRGGIVDLKGWNQWYPTMPAMHSQA
jgi:hypothetical protein